MKPLIVGFSVLFSGPYGFAQGPGPTPVRTDSVRMELVQQHRMVTGDIMASRRANVATQEAGIVIDVPVTEGQLVQQGDVLAQLDNRRLNLQMAQTRADLLVAQAIVTQREAEVGKAKHDFDLLRTSFDRGGANAKELRDSESDFNIEQARLVAAQQEVTATQARIDLLDERLDDMTVTAPFNGSIVETLIETGEWVAEGDAVVTLVATDTVEAWLQIPQRYLASVRDSDDSISIQTDATSDVFESSERRIIPQVDPKARTFTLILTLDNAQNLLAPGVSITAWVPTAEKAEQLTVHKNALLRDNTGFYVYAARSLTPNQPEQAVPARVQLLFPIRDRFVIASTGLESTDIVIVDGNERLFPMAPVQQVHADDLSTSPTGDGS